LQRKARDPMVALAAGQFGLSIMQTLFMFYYVKVYLNVFKISEKFFAIAQALFLVWNAINDPLFGYLQDSSKSWLSNRRAVMRRLAPAMAISFIVMWQWMPYEQGIHLSISLFFYDAFYSAIGVAWSAMFAEVEGGVVGRASAMKHSQLAILLSVNVIPIAEKLSGSLDDFSSFQAMSFVVALLGIICMFHCSDPYFSKTDCLPTTASKRDDEKSLLENDENTEIKEHAELSMTSVKQLLARRDFLAILFVNFIHNARSVMHLNFASITTELLVPTTILPKGSITLAIFYAACTLAPQIIAILSEGLVVRVGAHALTQASFVATVVFSTLLYFIGTSPYIIMIYMFIDSVAVHSTAPLFNILISEFIEDDHRRHSRSKPLSSLVFGVNALFVKPAQSIAPLAVVHYLNSHGYETYKSSHSTSVELEDATRFMLFIPPLLLAAAQWIAFRSYSLAERNRRSVTHNI
ncbi:hypothetical protein PFISCL1PPCAC_20161, partial [Pristionchus fissidentatus]